MKTKDRKTTILDRMTPFETIRHEAQFRTKTGIHQENGNMYSEGRPEKKISPDRLAESQY